MNHLKRILAAALCLATLLGLLPTGSALADGSTVTIESQTNSSFDYLEYYDAGQWHDLNTPKHWIESTGEIVYCVEHAATNPHGQTYTETEPGYLFAAGTLAGLNSILMYGYPNNKPSGFTDDEARQATANAIRFWLSERGEADSYTFTNRSAYPGYIRAKAGYTHVLAWADELLSMARSQQEMPHAISFNPSAVTLTASGSGFSGQVSVLLTNINSGYELNVGSLPAGASVSGYTGSKSETLSISLPASAAGKSFTLYAIAYDTRSIDNISAYVPSNGSLQKVFLCATGVQPVASATVRASAPAASGKLKLVKTGEGNAPLPGVQFGVYADSACKTLLATLTTGADGSVTSGDLPSGTVYVRELSTVSPYILTSEVKNGVISGNATTTLSFTNNKAQGKIRIEKTGEQLTGFATAETEYGMLYTPKYEVKGLPGVVFEVKDASGAVVATLTTDGSGVAETDALPLGTYTVREKSTLEGYILDTTVHEVTLAYKDQTTAVVTGAVKVENRRQGASVSLRKLSERFDRETMQFVQIDGAGFVFGLYTAEEIGELPENVLVEILVTDESGNAVTAGKLACGSYYLRELAVPDPNIQISLERYPVTIMADGSSNTVVNREYADNPIVNELFKVRIGINKLDAADHTRALAGAVFEVLDASDEVLCTMTTDSHGYAESIDLPVGEYRVREKQAPKGFALSDEVIDVTLTTADKETAEFDFENAANVVRLRKLDSMTKQPLANARIQVYGPDGKLYFEGMTGADGYLVLNEIPAGKYTWQEVAAPTGYALNTATFSFTVDEHGKVTGDTEFVNEPITLEITKINLYTGKPMAGIVFTLYNSAGNIVKTKAVEGGFRVPDESGDIAFKVDEAGKAVFKHLPAGTYRLVETVPSGYIAEDNITVELTDKHSETSPCKLTVNNDPTGIRIVKVDASTGKALTGAGFRIKIKSGTGFRTLTFTKQADGAFMLDENGSVTDLMVDKNGEALILGLPLGDVWIEESVVPEGYFPVSARKAEITRETSATKPMEIRITNSKFVKLGLDTDKYDLPISIGIGVLLVGGVVWLALSSKKKKAAGTRKAGNR